MSSTKTKKEFTCGFVKDGENILMGLKKRGFGTGLWNGFGGKVEKNETVLDAASREMQEESGLNVSAEDWSHFAIIEFEFVDNPVIMKVHYFEAPLRVEHKSSIQESEEMAPKWFTINEMPFGEMFIDAKVWFPIFMQGVKFKGKFLLESLEKILSYKITDYFNDGIILAES